MIQLDIIREAAPDVAEAMLNELLRPLLTNPPSCSKIVYANC